MHSSRSGFYAALACAAIVAAAVPGAATAADFYAGKTIDFLIGADVGGGYDIYARLLAATSAASSRAIPRSSPRTSPAPPAPGRRRSSMRWRRRTAR